MPPVDVGPKPEQPFDLLQVPEDLVFSLEDFVEHEKIAWLQSQIYAKRSL